MHICMFDYSLFYVLADFYPLHPELCCDQWYLQLQSFLFFKKSEQMSCEFFQIAQNWPVKTLLIFLFQSIMFAQASMMFNNNFQ